jgi:hypothetical protein
MTKILTNPQGKVYISSGGKALLSTGSGSATLITKTITQNGIYNASSDNADGYSSVTVNVGGTPTGKYQLFERVKEQNNLEIGTVCGFFKDANDVEYAVVCLDYIFRASYDDNLKFLSSSTTITGLPLYDGNGDYIKLITNVYTNTATYNCDKVIAFCNTSTYTSSACTYCRSKSFVIGGTTYYGQIPNTYELFQIALNHERLGALDPTDLDDYNKSLIKFPGRNIMGSDLGDRRGRISTLYQSGVVNNNGNIADNLPVYPVLEIPNALS